MYMYNLHLNDTEILFVIGIIKELYKRQLITEKQMFSAIKKITEKTKEREQNK